MKDLYLLYVKTMREIVLFEQNFKNIEHKYVANYSGATRRRKKIEQNVKELEAQGIRLREAHTTPHGGLVFE
jgi:hypothetical protein